MTKAFSYLRVSGLSQVGSADKERDGFPRQLESVHKFAASHDYEIVRDFKEEGVSGKKDETERPAFMEMVSAILENGVRHVLVENLSRLAREYRIQEQLLVYLASKEIQLIACDTGENVTEAMAGDPMRKALVQIQGIFHELDRAVLVRKLASARKRKRDRGERCDGRKPYGSRPGEKSVLEIIQDMNYVGSSSNEIAEHLNEMLAPTRLPGSKWSGSQVRRILARLKKVDKKALTA